MRSGAVSRAAAVCLSVLLGAAAAQADDRSPITARQIDALAPGQFVWSPAADEAGSALTIVIALSQQRAYVFRDRALIGAATVSSGSPGHESPIGRFAVLEKQKMHRSNRYSAAPMPFMLRLNRYGVALHGGKVPGYPASHGCIRLPMAFAKALFGVAQVGSYVFVTEDRLDSPKAAFRVARRHAGDSLPADRMLSPPRMAAADEDRPGR